MDSLVEQQQATAEPQPVETGTAKLHELFASAPALRHILRSALEACREPRKGADVDSVMQTQLDQQVSVFAAVTLRGWLEEAGGLTCVKQQPEGEGEPFEVCQATEAGLEYLEESDPAREVRALVDSDPENRSLYLFILDFCRTPKDKQEIEDAVYEQNLLPRGKSPYPTAFLGTLEDAGGIRWAEKWSTTEEGKQLL